MLVNPVVIAILVIVAIVISITFFSIYRRRRNDSTVKLAEQFLQSTYPLASVFNFEDINRDPSFLRRYRKYLTERRSSDPISDFRNYTRHLISDRPTSLKSAKKLEHVINEKKDKLLSIPSISFHYANKKQIESFYNDYFKEPTISDLVTEITGEISGDIKGSIPQILESRLGTKDLSKWISTIKLPEASLNGMFVRYQRETIRNGQVTLGLEEVDIELSELEAFDDAISDLDKRFDLKLKESLIEDQRTHLRAKAAERTLSKLEEASGWILVEGRFKIEAEDDFFKCVYPHPVTNYLPENTGPVVITVLLRQDSIEPHVTGNYKQSIGLHVPMKVYGQVWQPIDRSNNIWELQVTPLAIY